MDMYLIYRKIFLRPILLLVSSIVIWGEMIAFNTSAGYISFNTILVAILIIVSVTNNMLCIKFIRPTRAIVYTLLLLLLSLLLIPWSAYPSASLSFWIGLLMWFFILSIVAKYPHSYQEIETLKTAYIVGGIILSIIIFSAVLFEHGVGVTSERKIFEANPNFLSGGLVSVVPFIYVRLLHNRKLRYFFIFIFMVLAIFISGSRASAVAIILSIFLMTFLALRFGDPKQRSNALKFFIVFCVILSVALIAIMFSDFGAGRVERFITFFSEFSDEKLGRRALLFPYYTSLIFENPWTGHGIGMHGTFNGRIDSPHNAFLSVAYGTGILGLFLFIGILSSSFFMALRLVRVNFSNIAFIGVIIGVFVNFMTSATEANRYFPLVLGLLIATYRITKYRKNEKI